MSSRSILSSTTRLQIVIISLLGMCSLIPFLMPLHNLQGGDTSYQSNNNNKKQQSKSSTNGNGDSKWTSFLNDLQSSGVATRTSSTTRVCKPGECAPLRYFATTSSSPPQYYVEPNLDPTGRNGILASIPSRPWDESSIIPLDPHADNVNELIRTTMEHRYNELIQSDMNSANNNNGLPKYLPPQFPQWDRSVHKHIASSDTRIIGMPPKCCPVNIVHQMLTKDFSDTNVLSEEELNDCQCRSPRNYPTGDDGTTNINRPIATIVTAFYEMSSKHPKNMYERTAKQLLSTSDPMIIFCEPGSSWVDFFTEERQHAPTVVVPMSAKDLRLVQRFPQDTFWKKQFEIDPEGSTHHKKISTMLYVIWDEKLVLLQAAAMINPFNTTQFAWVDTGYWRNPAPHLYRNSAVRINVTKEGVSDDALLLYQMKPYKFNRETVISGDTVLVGGNCFAGTYNGISNMYSAFYDTWWTMSATGKFVGSDQKVMYRTCHTYPTACHIHKASRGYGKWLNMLGTVLPDLGEKIAEPLKVEALIEPLQNLPIPPNGVVDDATSKTVWKNTEMLDLSS